MPVYVVTDAEIAAGQFTVEAGPAVVVSSLDVADRGVAGGNAIPVYPVDAAYVNTHGIRGGLQGTPVIDATAFREVGDLQRAIPVYVTYGTLGSAPTPPTPSISPIDPSTLTDIFAVFDASVTGRVLDPSSNPPGDFGEVQLWLDTINTSPQFGVYTLTSSYRPIFRITYGGMVTFENDRLELVLNWPGNKSTAGFTVVGYFNFEHSAIATQTMYDGATVLSLAVRMVTADTVTMACNGVAFTTSHTVASGGNIFIHEFNGANSAVWYSPVNFAADPWTETGSVGTGTLTGFKIGCDATGSNRLRGSSGYAYLALISGLLTAEQKQGVGLWISQHVRGSQDYWRLTLA